jgi:hypothetical protein
MNGPSEFVDVGAVALFARFVTSIITGLGVGEDFQDASNLGLLLLRWRIASLDHSIN